MSTNRTHLVCPGCDQEIWITDGATECGGEGEGICCVLVTAQDGPEGYQAEICAAVGCDADHSPEAGARAQFAHDRAAGIAAL